MIACTSCSSWEDMPLAQSSQKQSWWALIGINIASVGSDSSGSHPAGPAGAPAPVYVYACAYRVVKLYVKCLRAHVHAPYAHAARAIHRKSCEVHVLSQ